MGALTVQMSYFLHILACAAQVREGIYSVQNVHSGRYLNVAGGSMRGGANVWLWGNAGSDDSKWHLRLMDGGAYYTLQNVKTSHYLAVGTSAEPMGANVQVGSEPGSPVSQWILAAVPNGDGTSYTWKNVKTGLFINDAGGGAENGANVQMWDNPGSTHSQWELIGHNCHDAAQGDVCYADVEWALNHGIKERPDWYPGLSVNSSSADIQAHLHFCFWRRCPLPCTVTEQHNCSMVGRFWDSKGCEDAAAGSQCRKAIDWAVDEGIPHHPDWYKGLDRNSSVRQFQAHLCQGQSAGLSWNGCKQPCCHDALPGELCHEDAAWAMMEGIHHPDAGSVYPPSLNNKSKFVEFQAYLHLCYPQRCPEPCAKSSLMKQAEHLTLQCPDK
jgi:hypothetical protein